MALVQSTLTTRGWSKWNTTSITSLPLPSPRDRKGRELWEDAHELGLTLHTDPSSPSRAGNSVCVDTCPDLTFSKNVTDLKWTNSE
ncbi:hypothetical protein HPB50_008422 [Hyalomma asiaticum]|uniref:Uncharacterized protein n=1 Tax=Hyalomma asiaticum TaxID=266040 RepID=A0ACB7S135_HYAAI|nr:hypothetical protein HPB50_008422 [Hyalomma asiaticum]